MNKFKTIFLNLRNSKNFTQEQMAKELGVSKSTIAMWETGNRLPAPDMFEQIADYFNVDLDYLYGRSSVKRKIIYDEFGNEYKNSKVIDYVVGNMEIEVVSLLNKDNLKRLSAYANKLLSLQKMEEEPVLMAAHHDNPTEEQQLKINKDMDILKRPTN